MKCNNYLCLCFLLLTGNMQAGNDSKRQETFEMNISGEGSYLHEKCSPNYLTLDIDVMKTIKHKIQTKDKQSLAYVDSIVKLADKEIKKNVVYTVMSKGVIPPSGDKHDFISMAFYWWPNPDTKDGLPYIRKDGRINPECKVKYTDQVALLGVTSSVFLLGNAYYYTGNEKYVDRINHIIYNFFLNPKTKMNPNLKYGKFVKGRNEGRGTGIIDTSSLVDMFEGISLISNSKTYSKDYNDGLMEWVNEYVKWLSSHQYGIDERNSPNNHGTHYDKQIISMYIFTNHIDEARKYIDDITKPRLLKQLKEDGSQPQELKRTKSWNYSNMNMKCFYEIALISDRINIDLWNYKADRKEPLLRSMIDWFIPYLSKEKAWKWEQIQKEPVARIQWALETAAIKYNDKKYTSAIDRFQTINANIVAGK